MQCVILTESDDVAKRLIDEKWYCVCRSRLVLLVASQSYSHCFHQFSKQCCSWNTFHSHTQNDQKIVVQIWLQCKFIFNLVGDIMNSSQVHSSIAVAQRLKPNITRAQPATAFTKSFPYQLPFILSQIASHSLAGCHSLFSHAAHPLCRTEIFPPNSEIGCTEPHEWHIASSTSIHPSGIWRSLSFRACVIRALTCFHRLYERCRVQSNHIRSNWTSLSVGTVQATSRHPLGNKRTELGTEIHWNYSKTKKTVQKNNFFTFKFVHIRVFSILNVISVPG